MRLSSKETKSLLDELIEKTDYTKLANQIKKIVAFLDDDINYINLSILQKALFPSLSKDSIKVSFSQI